MNSLRTDKRDDHSSQENILRREPSDWTVTFSPMETKQIWKLLKGPKREIFVTKLFILRNPIWIGDLRTEPKIPFV
jgi:hypothetical protein